MAKENESSGLDAQTIAAAVAAGVRTVLENSNQPASAAGLTDQGIAQILDEQRRKTQKDNPDYNEVSAFNPHGEKTSPRKPLTVPVVVNGHREQWEQLTHEEIAAYEQLIASLRPGERRTTRAGRYSVSRLPNGEVHIVFPCKTVDDLHEVPASARLLVRELMTGETSASPDALLSRLEALERSNAELAAQLTQAQASRGASGSPAR